jgi:hypothetical protein
MSWLSPSSVPSKARSSWPKQHIHLFRSKRKSGQRAVREPLVEPLDGLLGSSLLTQHLTQLTALLAETGAWKKFSVCIWSQAKS